MKARWLAGLVFAALPQLAFAQVEIKEWNVPWQDTRPRDPYVDGKGRVWFVGQEGNYIAYLTPESGEFKRYDMEAGTNPHNLIVDKSDIVWYTGNRNARLGRLDPATGEVRTFMMPDAAARDPHTIVSGKDGAMWFTVQGGNYTGRFMPATGKIDLIKPATANSRPYGIAVDSKGRPWVNLFNSDKIGMIDPATLTLKEIDLPRKEARGRRVAITSDDRVWYVDYAAGFLGVYNPADGKFEEWQLPGGVKARPYAMAVDDRDRIWLVETGAQPNQFVGFNPKSKQFFAATPIPSGGGSVRHMYFHAPTKSIWFGTDAGTIGRATLPY
jgi:virginiamycin B lyase